MRLDKPVGVTGTETLADRMPEDFPLLDLSEVAVSILGALKRSRVALADRSTPKRDYVAFIDAACEYGLLNGTLDRRALAASLGCSVALVSAMLHELRAVLRPMLTEVGVLAEAV